VLDAPTARWIAQEVSGDAAFSHIRFMTQFHRPRAGSDALMSVAKHYEEAAKAMGLDDVKLIVQADETRPWNARFADLWLMTGEPERIATTLQTPIYLADNSRAADVTVDIVDLGAAATSDFEGKDVKGKLVLSYGQLGAVMREAVQKRGAAGVIWYPSPFSTGNGIDPGMTKPDQVRWTSISSDDGGVEGGGPPTFAFVLSV